MKLMNRVLIAFTLVFAATAFSASAKVPGLNQPAYNQATAINLFGTITAIREVPAGSPLEGVHLAVKAKNVTYDVYLGPAGFMKMLRANYVVGDQVEVSGSVTKFGDADVVLTREMTERFVTLTLRDYDGAPVWENWGVAIDPASVK